MRVTHSSATRQQFRFLQRQFLQDGDLPLTNVLTNECLSKGLDSIKVVWKDRIYTPLVTLWVFLGQVLSADHSCRAAVARLMAYRCSQAQSPCSPETGAYCQARKRLPEKFFSDVSRHIGQTLDSNSDSGWLRKKRRVYIFDGKTVTMPDTEENQKEYPQNVAQEPGLRKCRVNIQQPGFRARHIIVVTTLLDAEKYPKEDLAQLYRARWNAELDLRALKVDLQMDILRCKTPELVRKEIWTHILAYNLIRTMMAQSAVCHNIEPRTISFKGAKQTLEAFQPVIALQCDASQLENLYGHLLTAIAYHRVGNRPGRFEPRKRKRREKRYYALLQPRQEAKLDLLKRFTKI